MATTQTAAARAGPETKETVIFVGHARLPQSLAPRDASAVVSVELEVDVGSGAILGMAATAVPELGSKLMATVLLGRKVSDGPSEAVAEIRRRYISSSQKAVCTAIANAFEAYQRYRESPA